MKLLTNREWHVEGRWYAPSEFLKENFKSVVLVKIMNDSSSAGDWDGMFVQKMGKWSYKIIRFFQENCYPGGGFRLTTGRVVAVCEEQLDEDALCKLYDELTMNN